MCDCQIYIISLIHTVAMTASSMISKTKFTHEETREAYIFAIDILKRLYSDDNVGFYAFDISYYCGITLEYAEMNDAENTLKALEESCKYVIIKANLKDMDYTVQKKKKKYFKQKAKVVSIR